MEDVFLGLLIVVIMLIVFINILLDLKTKLERLINQVENLQPKDVFELTPVMNVTQMKAHLDAKAIFKESKTKENPDLVYSPGKDSRGEAKGYKDDFYE